MNDLFMRGALDIAFSKMGLTSPNPPVGAVIARGDKKISSGGTSPCGGRHAEVNAIKSAAEPLEGAEMYVSLEPCSHFGKTSPCVEAIIAAGIKKVIVPILDPNPLVAGRGIRGLVDAGVEVVMAREWAPQASDMIRHFKKYILRNKSFIIHKAAITLDGRTASSSGDSKWITSAPSRRLVHRIRSRVDAVIVGKNTILTDRPRLDVRFADFQREDDISLYSKISGRDNFFFDSIIGSPITEYKNPLKVIIGLPEESSGMDADFYRDGNYLIYAHKADKGRHPPEKKRIIDPDRIVAIDSAGRADMIDLVLQDLAARGIMIAMLEGGSDTVSGFFDAGAIDQFIYFIAPIILGGGKPVIGSEGYKTISEGLRLNDLSVYRSGADMAVCGYRDIYNYEMM